ncbi:TPA: conserved phage C-terminal domain-containing protein [Streptococcus suis]
MTNRAFKGIWIPKEIWENKELTIMEKVFLVEIDSLDNAQGCWASNKYFAEFFGVSNGRCSQIIKSLEQKNLISIEYEREGKQITKRIIRVFRKLNTYLENADRGIKFSKEGYLENAKENNTYINNTSINNTDNMSGKPEPIPYQVIVDYLNDKAGTSYRHTTRDTQDKIKARVKEGFEVNDFKKVIDNMVDEWGNDQKMKVYLRPATLFGPKFESYLNRSTNVMEFEFSGENTFKNEPVPEEEAKALLSRFSYGRKD